MADDGALDRLECKVRRMTEHLTRIWAAEASTPVRPLPPPVQRRTPASVPSASVADAAYAKQRPGLFRRMLNFILRR